MSYGSKPNLVHKWRRLASDDGEARSSSAFIPVSVASEAPACEPQHSIGLELQRAPVRVCVRWPIARPVGAWLREMLR